MAVEAGERPVDRAGNALRLLLVHAHPDDETTGTGATMRYYAEQGVGVHLVTCTRGERGEILDEAVLARVADPDPDVAGERLGEHRVTELAMAGRELGLTSSRFLGGPGRWWDSGMAGEPSVQHPKAFSTGDLSEQADELARVVRELRPQAVVTYDGNGGYGHPDHVRAHDVTMAGIRRAADDGAPDGLGTPWVVEKVYAGTLPHSLIRRMALAMAGMDIAGPNPFADAATEDEDALARLPIGVPDDQVAARIDARKWGPAKVAAMRAYRSQMDPKGWFFALAEAGGGDFGIEYYQLLAGTASPTEPGGLEDDFFAGIRAKSAGGER